MNLQKLAKRIFSGITPKAKGDSYVDPPQGVRFIRSGEITSDGGVLAESNVHISESIHAGLMRRSQIQRGDLLIAIVGATIGSSGIYESDEPANINQAIAAVRFEYPDVLFDYVRWYLHSSLGQSILDFLKRPVARANINLEEIGEIPLVIPPLLVQQKLVKEMGRARKSLQRKLEQADALLSGLDAFLLESLVLTPNKKKYPRIFAIRLREAWYRCDADFHSPKFKEFRDSIERCGNRVLTVGEICSSIKTGFAAGREFQAFDDVQGIPHIRPLNISAFGELSFEGTKYFPKDNVDESEVIHEGEVLLNNTNSTEWVGKSTVFEGDRPCCCSNHISRLIVDPSVVLPWYLALLFNAIRSTGYLGLIATNFVNQAGINTKTLSSLRLPIPALKKQLEIVNELRKRRIEAWHLHEEAEREWEAAKTSFEAKLLCGEALL